MAVDCGTAGIVYLSVREGEAMVMVEMWWYSVEVLVSVESSMFEVVVG